MQKKLQSLPHVQNPPCAPLTKGGRNFHVSHKLLNAHYEASLAPLDKGGWGDSNPLYPSPKSVDSQSIDSQSIDSQSIDSHPFQPLIRQEESQLCN
jgi:hypothetical protein